MAHRSFARRSWIGNGIDGTALLSAEVLLLQLNLDGGVVYDRID